MVELFDVIVLVLLIVSNLFIFVGGFFVIVGLVGIVWFLDFYVWLYVVGVIDIMGVEFMLIGLMI